MKIISRKIHIYLLTSQILKYAYDVRILGIYKISKNEPSPPSFDWLAEQYPIDFPILNSPVNHHFSLMIGKKPHPFQDSEDAPFDKSDWTALPNSPTTTGQHQRCCCCWGGSRPKGGLTYKKRTLRKVPNNTRSIFHGAQGTDETLKLALFIEKSRLRKKY